MASFSLLLALALLLGLIPVVNIEPSSANPTKMNWTIVNTPNTENNVIASPSEINVIVVGSDDRTFYAVDISNGAVYKSTDGGISWTVNLGGAGGSLVAAGAILPVWNLAVAPDDVNFLVAVTDGGVGNNGPKVIFASEDGGANWYNANFLPTPPLGITEYISCVDISVKYGINNRDIAIGTRDGLLIPGGRVFVAKMPGFVNWANQLLPAISDVIALKFSPSYTSDSSLVVVSSSALETRLHMGYRDTGLNTTNWNFVGGYPVLIIDTNYVGTSPTNQQIITADIDLPADFFGTNPSLRRVYVSTDIQTLPIILGVQWGVYRIDDIVVYWIKPPTTVPTAGRISSIAYHGYYAEGVLLAGEVTADPLTGLVPVWRTSDPIATTPTWLKSDDRKSPTGGFTFGFANAQVAWNSEGTLAYCGTSSANPVLGGTGLGLTQWPFAWTNTVTFDESAFSVSPCAPDYGQLLVLFNKTQDTDIGNIWNQLTLIDTMMATPAFLSDVAALEAPEPATVGTAYDDYDILYLASINNAGGSDSIWRSTSDPLGTTWERVLCFTTTNDDIILRVPQTPYDEAVRSNTIVFADRNTAVVGYSADEGQVWDVRPFTSVNALTDLAVASSGIIYILDGGIVDRYTPGISDWTQTHSKNTGLAFCHTIAVPLKSPETITGTTKTTEDWVIVGEAGPPAGFSRVAWADFSQALVDFEPPPDQRVELPVLGNVHVIADDKFEQNKIVYAACNDTAGINGKIYRWAIETSTSWDELQPPNSAFYGLAQRNDALYGIWANAVVPAITTAAGADRTVFPRAVVPPPTQWDYLTTGLPIDPLLAFTREPNSLKISSNEDNSLWVIDNRAYNWPTGVGCLWVYDDSVAKVGPWTTSPASGDIIPVDPVTGRALEIDFKWHQLSYASAYELQLAKDRYFSTIILDNQNIVPVDQLAPECYFPAGGLVPTPTSGIASFGNLEAGHVYYWRVRARVDVAGQSVRSPWSATMYFTVGAGLPVMAEYPTVVLFSPLYGARGISRSPAFSWSPMPRTSKYEFVLAKDAALEQVVVKTNVPLTSYLYDGELDFNTTYFWRVRAIEPVVSDPSATGSFTVVAEEKPVETPVEKPTPIPLWVWAVIAVLTTLVAVMIAFALVKPSYLRPTAARATRLETIGDKPQSPIASIRDTIATEGKQKAAPVDKLDLASDKPQNPIARTWNAMVTRVRQWRFLKKPGDGSSLDKLG